MSSKRVTEAGWASPALVAAVVVAAGVRCRSVRPAQRASGSRRYGGRHRESGSGLEPVPQFYGAQRIKAKVLKPGVGVDLRNVEMTQHGCGVAADQIDELAAAPLGTQALSRARKPVSDAIKLSELSTTRRVRLVLN